MVLFVAFRGLVIDVSDSVVRKYVSSFILMGCISFTGSEEMVLIGGAVTMGCMVTTYLVYI
jgi:hypothetical protein